MRASVPILLALCSLSFQGIGSAQIIQVTIGVTPTCPYGLSACWGGAYEALCKLDGIASVAKTPDTYNCLATVSLQHSSFPDPAKWKDEFKADVHESYIFRGVEVTVEGTAFRDATGLHLRIAGSDAVIPLKPFKHKLQWNFEKQSVRQPEPDEIKALDQLTARISKTPPLSVRVRVTGPFQEIEGVPNIEVREFLELGVQK